MAIHVKNLDVLIGIHVINESKEVGTVVSVNNGDTHPIRVEYKNRVWHYTKDGFRKPYDGEISLHTKPTEALRNLMDLYGLSVDELVLLIMEEE